MTQNTKARIKPLPKQSPDNIAIFRIGRWRADHLNQEMMRTMRRIADKRGSTIEEVMDRALLDFVEGCVIDRELATKIIPFPMTQRRRSSTSSGSRRAIDFLARPSTKAGLETISQPSIEKSKIFALLKQSRDLYELLCFNTHKLAALRRWSQRRREQPGLAVVQR